MKSPLDPSDWSWPTKMSPWAPLDASEAFWGTFHDEHGDNAYDAYGIPDKPSFKKP